MATILVVEDEPLIAQDISLQLQHAGHLVPKVAVSAEEAERVAIELQPDLILMDIVLQGERDGIEAARNIQRKMVIPIVYLTADEESSFLSRARVTAPYAYLVKPCSPRELKAVVAIALDRSEIERQQREAEEVSAILANMSDPVIRTDQAGRVQMTNRAAETMLQASSTQMEGMPIEKLLILQRQARGPNVTRHLLACVGEDRLTLQEDNDLWLRRVQQSHLPVSLKISAIPKRSELQGGAVILLQDISSRVALQEELNLAAEVFKYSSEGILITDTRPHILRVNDAYLELTGYRRDEVIGRNPGMLASGYHDASFYKELWRDLLETGSWSGEIWNRRKNGEVFPELLNISSVRDEQGNPTHFIGIFTDISDSKNMQERLQYLTQYDSLTGLANRILFEERLEQSIADVLETGKSLALLMIDIDNFNAINEVSGHAFGDHLLKAFAERLAGFARERERVARFGGDVFALMVGDSGTQALNESVRALIDVLEMPLYTQGRPIQVTVSVGVALYPSDGQDAHDLLKCADNALHHAKRAGKNGYRFFDKAMYEQVLQNRRIEQGLRRAAELGELELVYQPQVDIRSGQVNGCEALVRWNRPGQGQLPPSMFIPIAEETGQIVSIGRWVMRTACEQFRRWHNQGRQPSYVAVNVSARQFRDLEFVSGVRSILAETAMQPQNLMLEVTESVAMNPVDGVLARLRELKWMGVRLSLDDFGTGFSALSSLQQYPFDTLKIDRSFVIHGLTSSEGEVMLEAIIKMGNALKLETIAEGVEEESQVAYLQKLGCQLVQGYCYSKPVDEKRLGQLVLEGFRHHVDLKENRVQ